jgi:hypothetical protein
MFKAVQQPRLLLLTRAVEQLYKTHRSHSLGELRRITADYRVCVREERAAGTGASAKSKRVVNYFALCGGIAMEELRDLGIKTIIMTSGLPQNQTDIFSMNSHNQVYCRHLVAAELLQGGYEAAI